CLIHFVLTSACETSQARIYIVCLVCSDDNRDLHSFPTRRSSDLHSRLSSGLRRRHGTSPSPSTSDSSPPPGGARPGRRLPRPGSDRKSTRLNSSHVSISYAVFCLKKKKDSDPVIEQT